MDSRQRFVAPIQKSLRLTINGQRLQTAVGTTVLEAARQAEIYIPTLCSHPYLKSTGTCRMCAVEIEGVQGLPLACNTPATEGMIVRTDSSQISQLRRSILEYYIADNQHPRVCLVCWRRQACPPKQTCLRNVAWADTTSCLFCTKNQRCEFQDVSFQIRVGQVGRPYRYQGLDVLDREPFFDRNYNLCIVCGRCVRVCNEVRGAGAITFKYRNGLPAVGANVEESLRDSRCQFCGACVDVCPTGALMERATQRPGFSVVDSQEWTVCPYCGVGCRLRLDIKAGEIIRSFPDPDGPANAGQACVKGKFGLSFINSSKRLTTPLVRVEGQLVPTSWEDALNLVTGQLAQHRGTFAAIASAQATNEDNYVLQKFVRTVMATNNIDYNGRYSHVSSVEGLTTNFGVGAMTNSIQDIGEASCILALGTSTCSSHPVVALQIIRAVRRGAKLIVVNPRWIDLCRFADLWLQPRPGTDLTLLAGMMRVILDRGWRDEAFVQDRCQSFPAFAQSLQAFDLNRVEEITGVPQEQIVQAAQCYAINRPATILYATGITQHSNATDTVQAIANLALLTGNVGKPGSGVNPLAGVSNTQGTADMGCLPNFYPGYQRVSNATAQQKFEEAWGYPLGTTPGLTLTEVFPAIKAGKVKALYVVGHNPLLSHPDVSQVEAALDNIDFLVVQDIFLTETARLAHVVLPAATFAEKEGTFTNTERRVQQLNPVILPPGEAKPDWWITCQLAQRMGGWGFSFDSPSQIMEEIALLAPVYGGMTYPQLENGGRQWPCPTLNHPGTPILERQGRFQFTPIEYRPVAEMTDADHPLILITGRSLWQFNAGNMTREVQGLNDLMGEAVVEINPQDAASLNLAEGELVSVVSRLGRVKAKAKLNAGLRSGTLFMAFHAPEVRANLLTQTTLDPKAETPALKTCAVSLEKN